jgi:hypothetical protein
MGQYMITSHREEGLHYQPFTGQLVITSYREDVIHYQLFKGQHDIEKKGFITNSLRGSP